jgi:hypothetical protein
MILPLLFVFLFWVDCFWYLISLNLINTMVWLKIMFILDGDLDGNFQNWFVHW